MSDSKEKSDDLIAELARLMASNAQGSEPGAKPTVIKLPPLSEASIPSPGPVRIPGMDAPKTGGVEARPAPAAAAVPTVRIPGMERPAGIADPAPVPTQAPRPASQVDFGKPPVAPSPVRSEPLANWHSHSLPSAVQPAAPARPAEIPTPLEAGPAALARTGAGHSPGPAAPEAAPAVPVNQKPEETETVESEAVSFDFGFSNASSHNGEDGHDGPAADPIADLIAAELDAVEVASASAPTPMPVSPAPMALKPAQAVPQRPAAVAVPLKPVSVTPRPAESDRFAVAPVFGEGAGRVEPQVKPPAQPVSSAVAMSPRQREELDPIDEIEDLIGQAVRVDLSGPEKGHPEKPAPVVPPLSTGFAPRRAGIKDGANRATSPEDAILAAAAASGAEVGRIEAPEPDSRPYKRMKVKPPKTSVVPSGARQYVGIAVAGTLLLASGFGLYWVLGMGANSDPSTAPVLTADAAPAKVEPTVTPTTPEQPSGAVVFNELDTATAEPETIETLVSRDETAGESPTEVARAVTPVVEQPIETGLANRKVRTVTVRPDGTIVAADDAVAGSEALPVERPNVPEIAGAELEPSELLTAAVAESEAGGGTIPAVAVETDPLAALVADSREATTTPLEEPAPLEVAALDPQDAVQPVFDGGLAAPIPMPRPANRSSLVGNGNAGAPAATASLSANEPAPLPLVSLTESPATAAPSSGGAYVQLASLPSEQDAQSQIRAQTSRFQGLFNGTSLEVRRVDLGAKGVWYRVVLPVSSFQEATQTCATIKANGGDCIPNNG